jgi:hypothetical protein
VLEHAAQLGDGDALEPVEPPLELGEPLALLAQLGLAQLRCVEDLVDEVAPDLVAQLRQPPARDLGAGLS